MFGFKETELVNIRAGRGRGRGRGRERKMGLLNKHAIEVVLYNASLRSR